jgi:muramoyltetrapeptide carboxypeptidase
VLSASSPVPKPELDVGLETLRFAGLEPVVYPSVCDAGTFRAYLAGDDALRAADLTSALTDPGIAGILFARGGSGAHRTIAAMDWDALRGIAPKVVAGYSDVTAVHEAVAVLLGWATVHSSMVATSAPATHYSFASLLRTIMAPERARDLRFGEAEVAVPGTARGVTVGGNLTVLTAGIGTPTSRPAGGGILVVEDDSEEPYRLDRMLTHLRRSGYLDGVAGIVTGAFTNCGPVEEVGAILAERLGTLGVPMISWADVGHAGPNQAVPLGIAAELDADARTLRLLDPPLVPASG